MTPFRSFCLSNETLFLSFEKKRCCLSFSSFLKQIIICIKKWTSVNFLTQSWLTFCNRQAEKYFRLWKPYNFYCIYSTLCTNSSQTFATKWALMMLCVLPHHVPILCNPMNCSPIGLLFVLDSQVSENTGNTGSHFPLQDLPLRPGLDLPTSQWLPLPAQATRGNAAELCITNVEVGMTMWH